MSKGYINMRESQQSAQKCGEDIVWFVHNTLYNTRPLLCKEEVNVSNAFKISFSRTHSEVQLDITPEIEVRYMYAVLEMSY